MVNGMELPTGGRILDVAAGTGSISRLLQQRGMSVIAVDLTREMLKQHGGRQRVLARGEQLPFPDTTFDGLTFGYLLRYLDDPRAGLVELVRTVKPGGMVGMVEFGLPAGFWRPAWRLLAGPGLRLAGRLIGGGWPEVSGFLRGSIEGFHTSYPNLDDLWRRAGLIEVRSRRMSLGGGLVMWGRRP